MKQKIIAVIPARYAATRFPAKLMQLLGDKPVIVHTYEAVMKSGLFDAVFVVTDSTIIYDEITGRGGKAIMSIGQHESGTDRIAEAVRDMDAAVIVNVQGDEPFIQTEPLQKIVALFDKPEVQVGSLMRLFPDATAAQNPNAVKVVTAKNGRHYISAEVSSPLKETKTLLFPIIYILAFMPSEKRRCSTLPPGRKQSWKRQRSWSSCASSKMM